ncbi:hypothetical protein V7S43_011036 [Phytophthora oleae]|uniref:Uncharacterized protein n=1 Tax=Phytophthora oleae TaxID=2107226 RepID=A0ABD3FB84_9STRA
MNARMMHGVSRVEKEAQDAAEASAACGHQFAGFGNGGGSARPATVDSSVELSVEVVDRVIRPSCTTSAHETGEKFTVVAGETWLGEALDRPSATGVDQENAVPGA